MSWKVSLQIKCRRQGQKQVAFSISDTAVARENNLIVERQNIRAWLIGEYKPSYHAALALSEYLGIELKDIRPDLAATEEIR